MTSMVDVSGEPSPSVSSPVATVPTDAIRPAVVEPSGRTTSTAWSTVTRLCSVESRSMLTRWAVLVTARTAPLAGPPTGVGQSDTRTAPGRTTASPGATDPVSSRPRASCHRSTAAVVAEVQSWSTVSVSELAKPSATRFSSSSWMSMPSSALASSVRHRGRAPNNKGTGRPSTSTTVWPRSITEPSAGRAVMVPFAASETWVVSP